MSGFRMSTRPTHFQPSSDWLVMMLMMLMSVMLLSDDRMNVQLEPSVLNEFYYLLLITSPVHLTQEVVAKKMTSP